MYNLNLLLDEVIENYETPKGYKRPSIVWSLENFYQGFGMYQYWTNSIIISRLLNTDKVSKEAIMSVIYHEIWHQEKDEHTAAFKKKMKLFPNYDILGRGELQNCFDELEELPPTPLKLNDTIDLSNAVFCVVPFEDKEDYLEAFRYFNHDFYVNISGSKTIPDEVIAMTNPVVIWLAESHSILYVIGWSDRNKIFAQQQTIRHSEFGGMDCDYQIKTGIEGFHILSADNCKCKIPEDQFPNKFASTGICLATEVSDASFKEVADFINEYNCDYCSIGISDDSIETCSPLIESNTKKLIRLSLKVTTPTRSLCLANLAVKQDPCFETVFNKADALRYAAVFDEAAIEVEKAHQLSPSNCQTIALGIKIFVMLDDYKKAKKYLSLLSTEDIKTLDDKELDNCIEFLKMN